MEYKKANDKSEHKRVAGTIKLNKQNALNITDKNVYIQSTKLKDGALLQRKDDPRR